MEPNETPIEEAPRKRRKDEEPLTWEEYQSVKGRWPTKDWNDEDQSFTTKKGTKSYARKLYYFNPLTEEQRAAGRRIWNEQRAEGWDKFVDHVRKGLRISEAAKRAGYSYTSVQARMREDPAFKEKVKLAEAEAAEPVEDSLFNAAINGNVPAAIKWLEKRSADRWPGDKVSIEQKNVYEIDAGDRVGNIIALMARLAERAELDAGTPYIDVESVEPE